MLSHVNEALLQVAGVTSFGRSSFVLKHGVVYDCVCVCFKMCLLVSCMTQLFSVTVCCYIIDRIPR